MESLYHATFQFPEDVSLVLIAYNLRIIWRYLGLVVRSRLEVVRNTVPRGASRMCAQHQGIDWMPATLRCVLSDWRCICPIRKIDKHMQGNAYVPVSEILLRTGCPWCHLCQGTECCKASAVKLTDSNCCS